MADDLDLIRSRVDLVDLVSERIALKRAGKSWKGLCPFHDDRNPSFHVNPELGIFKCWSCGAAGDLFTWVMRTENVEFVEAMRILAKRAGVDLQAARGPSGAQRELWQTAMETAQAFFVRSLHQSEAAQKYVRNRGLDEEAIAQWGIGYAPDVGEALIAELKRRGIPLLEAKQLFLVDGSNADGYHDRFRGRLMFPIHDERGQLVAFGGRSTGEAIPKYVNSSDTPLYSKRRVLYGMHHAKEAMRTTGHAVLVEGYLDVIACHRSGVKTAVASLGTALSEEHCRLLKRWCERATILFDADAAGQKAAERAQEMLSQAGLVVQVAIMPEGQDPDTLLRTIGPSAVLQAVEHGLRPTDYRLVQLRKRLKPSEDAFWPEAVAIIAEEPNLNEIARHIDALCAEYPYTKDKLRARDLLDRQVKARRKGNRRTAAKEPARAVVQMPLPKMDGAERAVIAAFFDRRLRGRAWDALRERDLFVHAEAAKMAAAIAEAFSDPPDGDPSLWLQRITDEETRYRLADLAADRLLAVDEGILEDALRRLRDRRAAREIEALRDTTNDADLAQIQQRLQALKNDFSTST